MMSKSATLNGGFLASKKIEMAQTFATLDFKLKAGIMKTFLRQTYDCS
jgi:hypothetical protein